jgi:uncharacterized membrane protein YfcA
VLRATVASCFVIGEVISLAILGLSGKVSQHQILTALALLPAVVLGAFLSRMVHHRLDGMFMRYVVLGFAIVSGIAVTVQAL